MTSILTHGGEYGQLACEDTQKVQSRIYYVISVYVIVLTYYC